LGRIATAISQRADGGGAMRARGGFAATTVAGSQLDDFFSSRRLDEPEYQAPAPASSRRVRQPAPDVGP
jgi:hypothetical protein